MDVIEIEIINWSAHNPRSSIKHPRWFALSNRILENPEMFDLTDAEFKAWIYILCQASQKNSSVVQLNVAHAERVCSIKKQALLSAIKKLEKAKCIQPRDHGVNNSVHGVNTSVQEKTTTRQDRTEQNNNGLSAEFEIFYSRYPKKEKKKEARKKFEALVKGGLGSDQIMRGLANYLAHLAKTKTDPKFFKQPTTWLNELPDNWINETPQESSPVKPKNYSEMATMAWHYLQAAEAGDMPKAPQELLALLDVIGVDRLSQMHRDEFRPGGKVAMLLQQAEKAAS